MNLKDYKIIAAAGGILAGMSVVGNVAALAEETTTEPVVIEPVVVEQAESDVIEETSEDPIIDESIDSEASIEDEDNVNEVQDEEKTIVALDESESVARIGDVEYATLEEAIDAAQYGDTIYLGEGKYTTYGNQSPKKSLTFVGSGEKTEWGIGATLPDPAYFGTEYNGDYSFDGCENITFKNMTLQSGTVDYLGFIRINNITVEDCTINGKTHYWGYQTTLFKNVIFNAPQNDYALWATTGHEFTFDTCTFNISGKAVNVYYDYTDDPKEVTINYKDCTVNSTKANKSVLNIKDKDSVGSSHNDSTKGITGFVVNFSGTNVVNGLNPDGTTCSRLFQIQYTSEDGIPSTKCNTTVKMDNVVVWKNGKMTSHHAEGTTDNPYTDGDHEDAFTYYYAFPWVQQDDGSYVRSVKRVCNYCGYTEFIEETGYTVTYNDGADGEIFEDQISDILISGAKTPEFNGTPTRTGYTFIGWSPEVTDTVEGTVTYVAQWKEDTPAPTPSESNTNKTPSNKSNSVDTGIVTKVMLWIAMAFVALITGIGSAISRKRNA